MILHLFRLCLLELPLVVVRVVLDPVEGDGRRQHRVRDGEGLADGEGLGAQLGAQQGARLLHLLGLGKGKGEILSHSFI